MKAKHIIWPAFLLMVLLQWSIPAEMIWRAVRTSRDGMLYKFKTAPVDPDDPFRGKYIVLDFEENFLTVPSAKNLSSGKDVYVSFSTDTSGFAKVATIGNAKPVRSDYLETTINYITQNKNSATVYINYPFTRFYMDEYQAPKAENIYRESVADTTKTTYALVSILNGTAVINDVFINDSSIKQIIRKRNEIK